MIGFGFWKNMSPLRRRIIAVVIVFVVIVIITAIGTLIPISQQDANTIDKDLNQTRETLKDNGFLLQYIYGNNFMITMIMFIPFLGPIFGAYVLFNTGTVIGAEAVAQSIPQPLILVSLFLTPVAWLEFISYSIAIAGSIWLSMRLLQSRLHEFVNTAKFISICAVILLASAAIETLLILLQS